MDCDCVPGHRCDCWDYRGQFAPSGGPKDFGQQDQDRSAEANRILSRPSRPSEDHEQRPQLSPYEQGWKDCEDARQPAPSEGPPMEETLWDRLSNGDRSDLNGLASQYGAVYAAASLMRRTFVGAASGSDSTSGTALSGSLSDASPTEPAPSEGLGER